MKKDSRHQQLIAADERCDRLFMLTPASVAAYVSAWTLNDNFSSPSSDNRKSSITAEQKQPAEGCFRLVSVVKKQKYQDC